MTAFRLALLTTLLLLAALMGLGLNLQLGWQLGRRNTANRLPHHVLYFLITLGTLATGTLALLAGQAWWPFLLLLALLLAMSRTKPGRPAHWRLALVIAVLYAGAAWLEW